jgi:RES domain-containing protein
MKQAWRIVKEKHAATAFDGEGAWLYGGRWNSPGRRVVYTSAALSLAVGPTTGLDGGTTATIHEGNW